MRVEFDCANCGAHVVTTRSPANMKTPPRFCGQRCHGEAMRGTGVGTRPNTHFNCEQCGKAVAVYRSPRARERARFCSLTCLGASQRGEGNPAFSGGRYLDANGYALVLAPDHSDADCRGYVLEHRLVAAETLGRDLLPGEVVHHENRVRDDNRPSNLRVFASQSEHMKHHAEHG